MDNQMLDQIITGPADEETVKAFMEEQKNNLKRAFYVRIGTMAYLAIVGTIALIVFYGVFMWAMFVFNLLTALKENKTAKQIENGEISPKELYKCYESMQSRSTLFVVLNIVFGGGLGCIGAIHDKVFLNRALAKKETILGPEDRAQSIAEDSNAQWHYCFYCHKNKKEAPLYRMSDGVICRGCAKQFEPMLPKRRENPTELTKKYARNIPWDLAIQPLTVQELKEREAYWQQNKEKYAGFTPTKVLYDGCLELDEKNRLFRIGEAKEGIYDSTDAGLPSGLIHPYDDVVGICYENIYTYVTAIGENDHSSWEYTCNNAIVLAMNNPYINAEVFTLKQAPSGFFNVRKAQDEQSEQVVNELHEILGKPVLKSRVLRKQK